MVNYIRCQLLFRKLTVRNIIILNNHSNAKLKLFQLRKYEPPGCWITLKIYWKIVISSVLYLELLSFKGILAWLMAISFL